MKGQDARKYHSGQNGLSRLVSSKQFSFVFGENKEVTTSVDFMLLRWPRSYDGAENPQKAISK